MYLEATTDLLQRSTGLQSSAREGQPMDSPSKSDQTCSPEWLE